MTRINIEALDEEELLDLHARIVERLAGLHRKRTAQALAMRYQPGMQVMFDAPGLGVVSATVVRPNQKTVTVRTETGRLWRVASDDLPGNGRCRQNPGRERDAVSGVEPGR